MIDRSATLGTVAEAATMTAHPQAVDALGSPISTYVDLGTFTEDAVHLEARNTPLSCQSLIRMLDRSDGVCCRQCCQRLKITFLARIYCRGADTVP